MNSRLIPEVCKKRADGGDKRHIHVKATKIQEALERDETLEWPTELIPLAEIRMVGPFDFSTVRKTMQGPKKRAVQEHYRIDEVCWQRLEQRATLFSTDVSAIRMTPTRATN